MKLNEKTIIVHPDVVLVPYREEHVEKYHEWMTDPELRELTASEPLSLEEEYEMQRRWREDEDKLTFILLAGAGEGTEVTPEELLLRASATTTKQPLGLQMIGDANLFLKGRPGEDEFEAEVEIMIAEPAFRRKGLAYTALQLLLSYATSPTTALGIPRARLVARIGEHNAPSIRLFEKLGFAVTKRVAVFEEVEMRYAGPAEWVAGEVKTLA